MRILAVDDSKVARTVLRRILGELGYTDVSEASDGEVAFNLLRVGRFDLVITDWNMPGLDGLELVLAMRDNRALSDIPVLMVSSEAYTQRIVDVMNAGAHGYIRKPFQAPDLRAKIVEVLKKRELREKSEILDSSALAGQLEEIGFPELVQFLSTCGMTGRLVIETSDGEGFVDVRDGELLSARFGGQRGESAIYAIARRGAGKFRFLQGREPESPTIDATTTTVVIEAMRRRDGSCGVA